VKKSVNGWFLPLRPGLQYFFEGYLLLRIFFNPLIEMIPRIGFIIRIFLICLTIPLSIRAQQKDCRKVDVTVDITHLANGQKGSIKVSAKEADAKFTLHLLTTRREDRQHEITSGTIKDIPSGTYELIIHYSDPKYCTETRKVTIN
jgi:hypothetical protein